MVRTILIMWLILAVAVGIAAAVLPGVDINGGFLSLLWVALLFGLVNALLGPILRLIALPLTIITLGLFSIIINTALVGITAWLSSDLDVDGFFPALGASIVISIVTTLLGLLLLRHADDRRP